MFLYSSLKIKELLLEVIDLDELLITSSLLEFEALAI